MSNKIMTQHPAGKSGVNISRAKYDTMRAAIEASLAEADELTFQGLLEAVRARLDGNFDGSINWYCTVVKQDLEAKGVLENTARRSPQRLRLTGRE